MEGTGTGREKDDKCDLDACGNKQTRLAEEVSNDLAKGLQDMVVDPYLPDLNAQVDKEDGSGKDQVSGLNSFAGTSGDSTSFKSGSCAAMDVDKQKRGGITIKKEGQQDDGKVKDKSVGESPAKRSRLCEQAKKTLTGAHDEPRQEP